MKQAPGKAYRQGISLDELFDLFSTEDAARQWFEKQLWPDGPVCPRCGLSDRAGATKNGKPMSHWCGACRRHFSVRMGTVMEESRLPLRKWAIAIYLETTNLKGVSSMKLHRDLRVSQKTAWFMLHRIREAWKQELGDRFEGPVEIDETFVGGKARNMHAHKRVQTIKGRGTVGKTAVIGAKDRQTNRVTAAVIKSTDQLTLQGFVVENVKPGAKVYTDDHGGYVGLPNHETVRHSVKEYVNRMAHTNGIESFWSMLKRGHKGVYHKMSPKHLHRYINEFAGRHNQREDDTIDQMAAVARGLGGRRLQYKELVS